MGKDVTKEFILYLIGITLIAYVIVYGVPVAKQEIWNFLNYLLLIF